MKTRIEFSMMMYNIMFAGIKEKLDNGEELTPEQQGVLDEMEAIDDELNKHNI